MNLTIAYLISHYAFTGMITQLILHQMVIISCWLVILSNITFTKIIILVTILLDIIAAGHKFIIAVQISKYKTIKFNDFDKYLKVQNYK